MERKMTDKEKLENLLCKTGMGKIESAFVADSLIAHGVTIRDPGEWIMRGGRRYCSVCGERACVTRDREDFWYTVGTAFCPNCGAEMKGESND